MNNKKGFSLLELLIVMGISTILIASIAPVFVKQVRIKAAANCAAEIKLIQDCALKYYVDSKEWPAAVSDMQNEGLLNPEWNGKNAFGNDYSLSSGNTTFTVTVDVPQDVQGLVLARASETDSAGGSVSSTVSAPGLMDRDKLVHLYAEADELRTMDQEIFVSKIELPDSDYNSDFQTGEGRLKDIYVAKAGKWLSEMRPTVTETEDVVVQTVHHHHANPTRPPQRVNTYNRLTKWISWYTGPRAMTRWYINGSEFSGHYSMGEGIDGTRDRGNAWGHGLVNSFPVGGNGWGGTWYIGGYRPGVGGGGYEIGVEVWGHYWR